MTSGEADRCGAAGDGAGRRGNGENVSRTRAGGRSGRHNPVYGKPADHDRNTEASLGLETDETGYRLEVIGDAVTVSDGTVRAVKPGSALVVAYSADGLRMTALSVEVRRVGEQGKRLLTQPRSSIRNCRPRLKRMPKRNRIRTGIDTETSASAGNEMTVPDSSHTGETDEITADRQLGYTIVAFGASVLGIRHSSHGWFCGGRKLIGLTGGQPEIYSNFPMQDSTGCFDADGHCL